MDGAGAVSHASASDTLTLSFFGGFKKYRLYRGDNVAFEIPILRLRVHLLERRLETLMARDTAGSPPCPAPCSRASSACATSPAGPVLPAPVMPDGSTQLARTASVCASASPVSSVSARPEVGATDPIMPDGSAQLARTSSLCATDPGLETHDMPTEIIYGPHRFGLRWKPLRREGRASASLVSSVSARPEVGATGPVMPDGSAQLARTSSLCATDPELEMHHVPTEIIYGVASEGQASPQPPASPSGQLFYDRLILRRDSGLMPGSSKNVF